MLGNPLGHGLHHLCISPFWAEHPCTYFDVHQGYRVLTSHFSDKEFRVRLVQSVCVTGMVHVVTEKVEQPYKFALG